MDDVWGAYTTPSLRVQTAPELEDAGIYINRYVYIPSDYASMVFFKQIVVNQIHIHTIVDQLFICTT